MTDEALENVQWPKMRVNSNDNDAVFKTKLNFQVGAAYDYFSIYGLPVTTFG